MPEIPKEVVAATKYTPAISKEVADTPERLQENAVESRESLIKELAEIMDEEDLLNLLNSEREKHRLKPEPMNIDPEAENSNNEEKHKPEPEQRNIDPKALDLNAVDIEEYSVEAEDAKEEAEEKEETAREQTENKAELAAESEKNQEALLQQRAESYADEARKIEEEEKKAEEKDSLQKEKVFVPEVVAMSPRDELLLLLKEGLDQHGIEYSKDKINELDHRELRKLADELKKYNTEGDYKGLLEFSKKNELSFSEPKKKDDSNNYDFASLNAKISTAVQNLERSTEKALVSSVQKALDVHGIKYNKEKLNNLDHKALRDLAGELKKCNTPDPDYKALMKFGKESNLEFNREGTQENNQLKDNDFINALNSEMDKAVKNNELLNEDEPRPVLKQSAQAPSPSPSMRPKQAKKESVPEETVAASPEKEQFNAVLKEMMEKFYQSIARSQAENALSPNSSGVNSENIVQNAGDKGMAEGRDKAAKIAIPSGPFSNPPSTSASREQDSTPSPTPNGP